MEKKKIWICMAVVLLSFTLIFVGCNSSPSPPESGGGRSAGDKCTYSSECGSSLCCSSASHTCVPVGDWEC